MCPGLKSAEKRRTATQLAELRAIFADLDEEADLAPELERQGGNVEACLAPLFNLQEGRKREQARLRAEEQRRAERERAERNAADELFTMFQDVGLSAERVPAALAEEFADALRACKQADV